MDKRPSHWAVLARFPFPYLTRSAAARRQKLLGLDFEMDLRVLHMRFTCYVLTNRKSLVVGRPVGARDKTQSKSLTKQAFGPEVLLGRRSRIVSTRSWFGGAISRSDFSLINREQVRILVKGFQIGLVRRPSEAIDKAKCRCGI
jgi:hypothetical protein